MTYSQLSVAVCFGISSFPIGFLASQHQPIFNLSLDGLRVETQGFKHSAGRLISSFYLS